MLFLLAINNFTWAFLGRCPGIASVLSYNISRDSGRKSSLSFLTLGENSFFSVIRCCCLAKAKLLISACTRLEITWTLLVFSHLQSYTGERNFILTKTAEMLCRDKRPTTKASSITTNNSKLHSPLHVCSSVLTFLPPGATSGTVHICTSDIPTQRVGQ